MAETRLSNVVGAPFSEHVLTQLDLRAFHNSTGTNSSPIRTNEDVLFLANKMAWAKLTSSIRIVPSGGKTLNQFYSNLNLGSNYRKPEDLAKNWILEAGTSIGEGAGITLRKGIGEEGSYGLGGIQELGYRPMPGLTSITVDSKGTLGSIREATINFKVWNMDQLNIIEALYFRLGYSMLLEWGHVQFFNNVNQAGNIQRGTFTTNVYGIDPFEASKRKEDIQQNVARRGIQLGGNYDGMLGLVTNFTWSFNQEGGYDCTVKLMGLGSIIESLRINLSYKMPDIIFQDYNFQQELIRTKLEQERKEALTAQEQRRREELNLPPLPALPTYADEIYSNIYTADLGTSNPLVGKQDFLLNVSTLVSDPSSTSVPTLPDYFYKAEKGGKNAQSQFTSELNTSRTGLFLNPLLGVRSKWQVLFAQNSPPISLSKKVLNGTALEVQTANNITVSNNALGTDDFIKFFDEILRSKALRSTSTDVAILDIYGMTPEDKVFPGQFLQGNSALARVGSLALSTVGFNTIGYEENVNLNLQYSDLVKLPDGQSVSKDFQITLSYKPIIPINDSTGKLDPVVEKNRPTRRELVTALQNWFNGSRKVNVTSIESIPGPNNTIGVIVKGSLADVTIPSRANPEFEIQFNNTGIIESVLPPTPATPAQEQQAAASGNSGDAGGTENESSTSQTDSAQRFASALHAMLSAVKSQIQTASLNVKQSESVFPVSLVELTKNLYRDTIFDGIIDYNPPIILPQRETKFNLKNYAAKGFNSNLMVDPEQYGAVIKVDFDQLCTGYGIRYTVKGRESKYNFPTYIKLGYLLSFLNSMCLVYDSTQDTNKHPYVYIDFNPETNFCLTSPQHLSINPLVCMIPFEGSGIDDYLKLYPESLRETVKNKADILFSPATNAVSSFLNSFKTAKNVYQGKVMEILLNVDFLWETLNAAISSDSEHSVNLKRFLDDIVLGINKSLGNFNFFRVAYRDDTNTVIIKDDQFVPPYSGEAYMLDRNKYLSEGSKGNPKYGQLPVFGAQSLVREMEFKTNLSTKVSSVVAISAQADFARSTNSKDYSSFSYLNDDYEDAYKPKITNSTDKTTSPTATTDGSVSNDLNQALQFNTHLLNVYYNGTLSESLIDFSTNYYIERMSNIKPEDPITNSAPFIPANLSITIDGVSGIVMGNAFTIPENRLPLSLRGTKDQTKVGFIVVGLTHVIDRNQWLTKIRGQMIRLRDSVKYSAPGTLEKVQTAFQLPGDAGGSGVLTSSGCRTAYPNLQIIETVQVDTYPVAKAAAYLKSKYPNVGKAAFAIILAEASRAGSDNFRSAGGNNFGGVQTDSGVWAFSNFNGQFCRRDSANRLRMFASFTSPEAFLDFLANRVSSKGFSSSDPGDRWTSLYIDSWWSPEGKTAYVKGSSVFNEKLSIFNSASRLYDRA